MESTNEPRLEKPEDWDLWYDAFQGLVQQYNLEDYFDGTTELRTIPIEPEPKDYKPSTAGVATRSSTAASSTATPDSTATVADLTPEQQTTFKLALEVYRLKEKAYEKENNNVGALVKWIRKTVSAHYQRLACKSKDPPKAWIHKLKEACSEEEDTLLERARRDYKAAIKPLIRPPKDIIAWITKWEKAFAIA